MLCFDQVLIHQVCLHFHILLSSFSSGGQFAASVANNLTECIFMYAALAADPSDSDFWNPPWLMGVGYVAQAFFQTNLPSHRCTRYVSSRGNCCVHPVATFANYHHRRRLLSRFAMHISDAPGPIEDLGNSAELQTQKPGLSKHNRRKPPYIMHFRISSHFTWFSTFNPHR